MENMNTVMRSCLKSTFSCFLVAVEKWEVDLCAIQSKLEKKKSVTGKQNMKILRKKRRSWPKKCFQRLKRLCQRKGKNKKTEQ